MKKLNHVISICLILFCSLSNMTHAKNFKKDQDFQEEFKRHIVPESGLWWNKSQTGTGLALQVSKNRQWFAS